MAFHCFAREIAIEASLRVRRHSADITCSQGEERTLGVCGDAFWFYQYTSGGGWGITTGNICCVCFSDAGLAVQQKDLAFSFPSYEVDCPGFMGRLTARVGFIWVVFGQCFDQSLSFVFHD